MEVPNAVKVVVVGDGGVGKTSMLTSLTTNSCPLEYKPTIFSNYIKCLKVNNVRIRLSLWDTAGQEQFDKMRPLSYKRADVIIIAFSIDSPRSFFNAESKWIVEAREHAPEACILLVGTKSDLAPGLYDSIREEEGSSLASRLKTDGYWQCSSLTQKGLLEMFREAAFIGLRRKQQRETRLTRLKSKFQSCLGIRGCKE